MVTKSVHYIPKPIDFWINFLWDSCCIIIAFTMTLDLFTVKFELSPEYFFELVFCVLAFWVLFLTHFSVRRLDRKYKEKLLAHPNSYLFVPIAWIFSAQTLIKNRWQRSFVYFMPFKDNMFKGQLRKEILPEFDYRKDVCFFDKVLFYGQFVLIILFIGLAFM